MNLISLVDCWCSQIWFCGGLEKQKESQLLQLVSLFYLAHMPTYQRLCWLYLSLATNAQGLGSTLHGRLCWSRGTLPCSGGRFCTSAVSRPRMESKAFEQIFSCHGMGWFVKLKDLLAKKLSSKNVRKAMAPRKEGLESASSIRLCRAATAMWNGFWEVIWDAAKAKGRTGRWRRWRGRWRRWRGRWGRGLTVLYCRDCCLYFLCAGQ